MPSSRIVALGLALVTLLVYLPVSQHAFILYDDPDYITQNAHVQEGITWTGLQWAKQTYHANNWHPLTWVSHMLDCELFGLEAGAHHLVNVLFHAGNAVLLFGLMRRMSGQVWVSLTVAALFAWHPLHVQSVAWASERKDVLSTFFFLLSIGAYLRHHQGQTTKHRVYRYWDVLGWFALGLASKPMLVTLPCVLLLLDFWPLTRLSNLSRVGKLIWEKVPLFVLSAASCVVTYQAQKAEAVVTLAGLGFVERLQNAVSAYGLYLAKMLWPINLAVIYPLKPPLPFLWISSLVVLVAISWLAWSYRNTRPHVLVGWCWYLGTLVPVIGIVQVGGQSMADRYTYIPLIGIFFALALEVDALVKTKRIPARAAAFTTGAILVACLGVTSYQLRFWRNTETLFVRAKEITGPNAIAEVNLGMVREEQGRLSEAIEHYKRAIEINPNLAQAHNNLANVLDATGETSSAVRHYEEALRLKPKAFLVRINFGGALARLGRHAEAEVQFREAVLLNFTDPRPWYVRAKIELRRNEPQMALNYFREALQRDPNHVQSLVYATRILAAANQDQVRSAPEALALAARLTALGPELPPPVLDAIAMAKAEAGDFTGAVEVQQAAIHNAANSPELEAMQTRLRLYLSRQPYRAAGEDLAR